MPDTEMPDTEMPDTEISRRQAFDAFGSPQEMARAARDAVTVELKPGDALYVPLMWPHSVQSIDASVTSNKYLYLAEGWLEYIDRAKTAPWLVYEMERGGLC